LLRVLTALIVEICKGVSNGEFCNSSGLLFYDENTLRSVDRKCKTAFVYEAWKFKIEICTEELKLGSGCFCTQRKYHSPSINVVVSYF
jgi:hypothetical protein